MDEPSDEETEKLLRELFLEVAPHFVWSPTIENVCAEFDATTLSLAPGRRGEVATAFRHKSGLYSVHRDYAVQAGGDERIQ
jgi:hypothetical protein